MLTKILIALRLKKKPTPKAIASSPVVRAPAGFAPLPSSLQRGGLVSPRYPGHVPPRPIPAPTAVATSPAPAPISDTSFTDMLLMNQILATSNPAPHFVSSEPAPSPSYSCPAPSYESPSPSPSYESGSSCSSDYSSSSSDSGSSSSFSSD